MKVRRCPLFCHDKHCPTCSGTGYVHEDGSPAMPEEMLEQLTAGKKPGRPVAFSSWHKAGR
jgi:hypothetical protein